MWIKPKTDHGPGDGLMDSDINRIEGNHEALLRGCFDVGGSTGVLSGTYSSPVRLGGRVIWVPPSCMLRLITLDTSTDYVDPDAELVRLRIGGLASSGAPGWYDTVLQDYGYTTDPLHRAFIDGGGDYLPESLLYDNSASDTGTLIDVSVWFDAPGAHLVSAWARVLVTDA